MDAGVKDQSSLFYTGAAIASNYEDWTTPQAVFDKLDAEFNFTLDAAASSENAKCGRFYTKEQDGLMQDWRGEVVFVNPPYNRSLRVWIQKAYKSAMGGATVVLLIPARTDTSYWHDFIFDKAEVRFVRGRLKFGDGKNSAPFPSAIVIYHGEEK